MTAEQGLAALQAGRDSVLRAKAVGTELFIGGEMGIGNTAAASAVACYETSRREMGTRP